MTSPHPFFVRNQDRGVLVPHAVRNGCDVATTDHEFDHQGDVS